MSLVGRVSGIENRLGQIESVRGLVARLVPWVALRGRNSTLT